MPVIRWFVDRGLLYFIKIVVMAALTGFNFWLAVLRWGWDSSNLVIKVNALLVAGVTEIGLAVFLLLFSEVVWSSQRRKHNLWGWGGAAGACIVVSLYVNVGYFNLNWQDASGVQIIDLLIRSVFLMVLLVGISLVPPKKRKLRTAADVQAEYEAKHEEARQKQKLRDIEATAQRREQSEKEAKRQAHKKEEAERAQMLRIATEAWGKEEVQRYSVPTPDGLETSTDWLGLEQALRAEGRWPVINRPPKTESLRQLFAANVAEAEGDGNGGNGAVAGNGGKKPIKTHYTIAEASNMTGVPARTIRYKIDKGLIATSEQKGPHGATMLTRAAVLKLQTGGNSNPSLPAIARQEDGNGQDQSVASPPVSPSSSSATAAGNLALDEEME